MPLDTEAMLEQIKQNVEENPDLLIGVAESFNDTSTGAPDFYYYRPLRTNDEAIQGDYLYFLAPDDIRKDENGDRTRPYDYNNPGFYSDQALTQKVSGVTLIDGDDVHEKVKIVPGSVLYMQDDDNVRFKIEVGEKPSQSRVSLDITRID